MSVPPWRPNEGRRDEPAPRSWAPPRPGGQPSWVGLTPPMRTVDEVGTGFSETYWRTEQNAARRVGRQRWGLPVTAVVLGFNLVAFISLPYVLDTPVASAVYVVAVMAPTVVAAVAILVISSVRGAGPVVDFGLPRTAGEVIYQLRTGVGWGLVALVAAVTVALFNFAAGANPPIGADTQPGLALSWRIVFAAWIMIGAPIGEELMFRGMLWGALEKQRMRETWLRVLGNKWVILVVTAMLFALFHREGWRLPVLITGGIVLGIARLRGGSIASSTVAHSVNNTLPALVVVFAPTALG